MSRYGSPYYYGDYWVNAAPTEPPTYTFPSGSTSTFNMAPPVTLPAHLTQNVGTNNVVVAD